MCLYIYCIYTYHYNQLYTIHMNHVRDVPFTHLKCLDNHLPTGMHSQLNTSTYLFHTSSTFSQQRATLPYRPYLLSVSSCWGYCHCAKRFGDFLTDLFKQQKGHHHAPSASSSKLTLSMSSFVSTKCVKTLHEKSMTATAFWFTVIGVSKWYKCTLQGGALQVIISNDYSYVNKPKLTYINYEAT